VAGRGWLTHQLVLAGFEVARPERDKGIDLIAYRRKGDGSRLVAFPIQLKAASMESFELPRKYETTPKLVLAYVWHLNDPNRTICYVLTYTEALQIVRAMKHDRGKVLEAGESWKKGKYTWTRIPRRLRERLRPYETSQGTWKKRFPG
jgi:hypothetical protein